MTQPVLNQTPNQTLTLTLPPAQHARGSIVLPGSKSLSIRAVLLASLARGNTTLTGVLDSDDTRVMIAGLQQLGVQITGAGTDTLHIQGGGFTKTQADIFVGNSGLSIRTLAAALAASPGQYRLFGVARMHERPIADLVDSVAALGADVRYEAAAGYPPLLISGRKGTSPVPVIKVKGNASSQYLTGLLQIAPLLAAQQDIVIQVQGELISKPYVDMTVQLMARFGVIVARDTTRYAQFSIAQGAAYQSPSILAVEGDASSASYFLAAGVLGHAGDTLTVHGSGRDSLQGDVHFATFLETLGVRVDWQAASMTVHAVWRPQRPLPAFDADFNHIPDAAMTAAVLALFADGPCTLRNIGSWRVKETDRLAAMAAELRKVGAVVEEGADWLRVTKAAQLHTASIHTYDDHRMAMCFSLLRFAGIPITIQDPACVNKTFPNYFEAQNSVCV